MRNRFVGTHALVFKADSVLAMNTSINVVDVGGLCNTKTYWAQFDVNFSQFSPGVTSAMSAPGAFLNST